MSGVTACSVVLLSVVVATVPVRPACRLGGAQRPSVLHPAVIPVVVFGVSFAVIVADRFSLVASAGIAGFTLLRATSTYRENRMAVRRKAAVAAFLGHVVTNLEAGSSLAQSWERAARHLPEECPAPLAKEIHQLISAARTGADPQDVLAAGSSPELGEVAALWALAINRGLPMAALLNRARGRIDAAQRHRAATEAALAGPKTTAAVLSLLPLAGVAMGSAMGANPLGLLAGGGVGGWLLVTGTALVCAGFLTCQHIIRRAAS
ncbi:type II secretion system F family protein [Corynebacterium qintianiae]|uniref:Type II secretion system F family protein n=1 Tax=Corynebacterium qintianiae TaxID=2709392 RepID=A0A7T0KP36_9CORY|nr:type II secretion system F family protein [Corynebacterium qintianiae]QPK83403.1 type II secretion system F family protein [Corynebacterium qintianiae]